VKTGFENRLVSHVGKPILQKVILLGFQNIGFNVIFIECEECKSFIVGKQFNPRDHMHAFTLLKRNAPYFPTYLPTYLPSEWG